MKRKWRMTNSRGAALLKLALKKNTAPEVPMSVDPPPSLEPHMPHIEEENVVNTDDFHDDIPLTAPEVPMSVDPPPSPEPHMPHIEEENVVNTDDLHDDIPLILSGEEEKEEDDFDDVDDTDEDKTWYPENDEESATPSQLDLAYYKTVAFLRNQENKLRKKKLKRNKKSFGKKHKSSKNVDIANLLPSERTLRKKLFVPDLACKINISNDQDISADAKIHGTSGSSKTLNSSVISQHRNTIEEHFDDHDENKQNFDPSENIKCTPVKEIKNHETIHEEKVNVQKKQGKKFSCFYCGEVVSKLPRHLQRKHYNELEVGEYLAAQKDSPKRAKIIEQIRNKGNFLHNSQVLITGEGNFIPKKIPSIKESNSVNNFLPCTYCKGFYKKKTLGTHVKKCSLKASPKKTSSPKKKLFSRGLQSKAALLLPMPCNIDSLFSTQVLGSMNVDNVFREVRKDDLILQYGQKLFLKTGDLKNAKAYISCKMRELGRLVIAAKEMDKDIVDLQSCLNHSKVSTVMKAIRTLAKADGTFNYNAPSVALKLVASINHCANIAIGNAARLDDETSERNIEKFIKIFKEDAQVVTSRALRSLDNKKFNKPLVLPHVADLKKLNDYLQNEAEELTTAANELPTKEVLRQLAENTMCKIICFNRKRAGEVQRIEMDTCKQIKNGNMASDIYNCLSFTEKKLARLMGRLEIVGKKRWRVPILLSQQVMNQIAILSRPANRKLLGVLPENGYLFAIPNSPNPIRGCDVLRKYAKACGAENPHLITSTKLRKHLAVMSQVMNLKKNELDILANFMGHDVRVHREFYRLPDDVVQLAKVSKVLCAMEKGNLNLLTDRNLNSIELGENDFVDEEFVDEDDYDDEFERGLSDTSNSSSEEYQFRDTMECVTQKEKSVAHCYQTQPQSSKSEYEEKNKSKSNSEEKIPSAKKTRLQAKNMIATIEVSTVADTSISVNEESSLERLKSKQRKECVKRNRSSPKTPWSDEENLAIQSYFKHFLTLKRVPGKKDCENAQVKFPILEQRSWDTIKSKVYNLIKTANA